MGWPYMRMGCLSCNLLQRFCSEFDERLREAVRLLNSCVTVFQLKPLVLKPLVLKCVSVIARRSRSSA